MPQHSLKSKGSKKSKPAFVGKVKKNTGQSQKKNRPAPPRKDKNTNTLRQEITKAINATIEHTAQERSAADGQTLRVLPTAKVKSDRKSGGGGSKGKGKGKK